MTSVAQRSLWQECLVLFLIAGVAAAISFWLHPNGPKFGWSAPAVEMAELAGVLHGASPILWVDARAAEAFDREHIPGAVLLNEANWDKLAPEFLTGWKPEMRVVVYCDSQQCDASQSVALRLQREFQITNIAVLKGGWAAWKKRS